MHTLLLADDEFYTRKGILNEIDFKQIGIETVIEADDGINALKKISGVVPDIALLDVRMPRMDGIQLAAELRNKFPDCVIIFISGYSDKEYLRSAIKLKALQYVDKPINNAELSAVLREAVLSSDEAKGRKQILYEKLRGELTRFLSHQCRDKKLLVSKMEAAELPEKCFQHAFTFLLKILFEPEVDCDFKESERNRVMQTVRQCFETKKLQCIHTFLDEQTLIIHFFSPDSFDPRFCGGAMKALLLELSKALPCPHFIAAGFPVKGAMNVYQSYNAAVISLQNNFFEGPNSVTFPDDRARTSYMLSQNQIERFEDCILHRDAKQAIGMVESVTTEFRNNRGTLVGNIKRSYTRLISVILDIAENKQINIFQRGNMDNLWDIIHEYNTLDELNTFLINLMNVYFSEINEKSSDNIIVCAVENFIEKRYSNPDFSLSMISDALNLTPAYICLVFKETKGKTINQCLTSLRLEMAKKYMGNANLKIADIALKVGYRDNNYFTKLFKRHIGVTPTEYREAMLK